MEKQKKSCIIKTCSRNQYPQIIKAKRVIQTDNKGIMKDVGTFLRLE